MKKILLFLFFVIIASGSVKSQNWFEGFESSDSVHLPSGWSVWNRAPFPIDPFTNWTVRDSGTSLPGLSTAKAKAHTGHKSIGVSWWSSVDTLGINTTALADAWLVTKRIHVWTAASNMSYFIALGGGAGPYLDSVQIWVSTVDSIPSSFTHYIETLTGTGPYGTFDLNLINFNAYVGQNIWVAFRYYMDCTTEGYFVNLDDVAVSNPIGIIPISTEVPARFDLKQNYPNPFNPVTNIEFDIAKTGNVNLVVYNSLGQTVSTLVDQELKAGTYRYDFNASNLPSGSYFYRLTAGDFVKTNKMILIK